MTQTKNKKSGSRTLLMSVLMSAPGPLVIGLGLLVGRSSTQIADFIQKEMDPKGVAVVVEAEHLCMTMRGIRAAGSKTQTSALRGTMRKDARTRAEVMTLLGLK